MYVCCLCSKLLLGLFFDFTPLAGRIIIIHTTRRVQTALGRMGAALCWSLKPLCATATVFFLKIIFHEWILRNSIFWMKDSSIWGQRMQKNIGVPRDRPLTTRTTKEMSRFLLFILIGNTMVLYRVPGWTWLHANSISFFFLCLLGELRYGTIQHGISTHYCYYYCANSILLQSTIHWNGIPVMERWIQPYDTVVGISSSTVHTCEKKGTIIIIIVWKMGAPQANYISDW